jgi:DNA-binding response OmpR family regulator
MRVLVAEDQVRLAETVAVGLRREGMAVDIALDGQQTLDRAAVTSYDVVVLDRDLPAVHGDEVCRQLIARGCEGRVEVTTGTRDGRAFLLMVNTGPQVPARQIQRLLPPGHGGPEFDRLTG